MADVNRGQRPLSPFMIGPYYRPQLTSMTSIFVRISGIVALGTALLVVWWLLAAATSESAFAFIDGLLRSWFGDLVLFFATWALWYHTLGRLRHVIWDFGYCFKVETAEKLGIAMIAASAVLTILTVIVV
ncbi:succinate dehydrogenase, cytochrome b556 subunit [Pseudoruegeria sp. SHC-113]|uniref:succinate dehydrogenase, cytochrome b556 subunit n=1 Tax=Pseudoruegeria sp. SHC-113 TaxID=2855439 RepID=UPI0021BACFC3|nr:succinate dehydrogenase, cytochrome b556 subunit [Pseudoruegeria sp. SHC-113]MCT8161263.1 succinate dehydrogenase, cytochrome b556 subunit [Pseudoruegeria sp. SHC-113]